MSIRLLVVYYILKTSLWEIGDLEFEDSGWILTAVDLSYLILIIIANIPSITVEFVRLMFVTLSLSLLLLKEVWSALVVEAIRYQHINKNIKNCQSKQPGSRAKKIIASKLGLLMAIIILLNTPW